MGTRSTIAILNKNGTVQSIYAHWDGYLIGNGAILYQHYANTEKVKKLIRNGSLSSLKKEIDPPPGVEHNNDKRAPDVTIFYCRDFNDEIDRSFKTKKYASLEAYLNEGVMEQYNYIFIEKEKKWYLIDYNYNKLLDLEDAIKNDERFTGSEISAYMKMKNLDEKLETRKTDDNINKKMKI